jgi:hypothetical protein
MTYSKKKLIQGLRYQISHSTEKARRALLLIYSKQTASEQNSSKTLEHNCEGFTTLDAEILTNIAKFLQTYKFLTPRQDQVIKRLIPKYAGQILSSSIERGLIRQVSPRRYEIIKKEENYGVL